MKLLLAILTTMLVPVFIALALTVRPVWLAAPFAFLAICFAAAAVMDWIMWVEDRHV